MKVRVYFYPRHEARDHATAVDTLPECDLHECFPGEDNAADYLDALWELYRAGRVWVGGGAHPLVLLTASQGDQP